MSHIMYCALLTIQKKHNRENNIQLRTRAELLWIQDV